MFREMRRKRQVLPQEMTLEILRRNRTGVLALAGDEGYPYAVPINYIYWNDALYFHGAASGHKIDAIHRESKASFCIIDLDKQVPEEYTTYFRSAIAFGKIEEVTDEAEKRAAITALAAKERPGFEAERDAAIEREWKPLCMLKLTIDHLSGKEAIELVREREKNTD